MRGIGQMSRGVGNSGQVIRGVIRGGAQMWRGGCKVERMPRSEQEYRSEQKQSGDLRGGQKLLGKQTGKQTYQMNVEGREEG